MAEIHQRLGRLEQAFECRSQAWLTDVESGDTLSAVEQLGLGAKLYTPLAATLQKEPSSGINPDLQAQLWVASAKLLENPLGRNADAIEAWRSALGAKPDNRDGFIALERLLAGAGRSEELVEVLERHLEMAVDGDKRKVIAKRIAVLYEDALKESEKAVRAWETVLEIDPNEGEALESLAQLHLAAGAYRELCEVYARKIDITDRDDERRMLFMQSARIYEQNLTEPDRAIEQLRALLAETPGDGEALTDLDRILEAEGRQSDLVEVIDARAAGTRDAASRDELAFRAARIVETELGDVDGAIGRYAKILAVSPQHAGARERARRDRPWRRLPVAGDRRAGADRAGGQVLGSGRRALRAAAGGGGRGRSPPRAARGDRAPRGEYSGTTYSGRSPPGRALSPKTPPSTSRAPRSSAWPRRVRTGRVWPTSTSSGWTPPSTPGCSGRWRCASRRSTKTSSPIWTGPPITCARRSRSPATRSRCWPPSSGCCAISARVRRTSSARCSRARRSWPASRARRRTSWPPSERCASGRSGNPEGALSAFRDAVERDPGHAAAHDALIALVERPETEEGALDVLEPLAEARGDYHELVALYGRRVEMRDDRAERAHWLRKIADVSANQLGQPEQALEALGRALKEEPAAGGTLDDLERIAGAAHNPGGGGAQDRRGAGQCGAGRRP